MLRVYMQQLSFDGESYTKGDVVDIYETYKVGCETFPFDMLPEAKDLPTRDWPGDDGRDIYIPAGGIPISNYETEVVFTYWGTANTIKSDLKNFINYLYGRNDDAIGGRLAIYDEHTGIGRKDVHVTEIDNDLYYNTASDADVLAHFTVKFAVEDPTTEVEAEVTDNKDGTTTVTLKFGEK